MVCLSSPQTGAVYFKIRLQYKRSFNGTVLETTGGLQSIACSFLSHCLRKAIPQPPTKVLKGEAFTFTSTDISLHDHKIIRICEGVLPTHVSGLLLVLQDSDRDMAPSRTLDEYDYFAMTILSQEHAIRKPQRPQPVQRAPEIKKLFENELLSLHPEEDRWATTGSSLFDKTLSYYVDRNLPVQFCLPAFPCKSTNLRKTSNTLPDGAEHEALLHLHRFCVKLQAIYPPGADFIIVSDGHVFSDCIGTHDGNVYKYTDAAKALSNRIHSLLSAREDARSLSPVRFVNLREVFAPRGCSDISSHFDADWDHYEVTHVIRTEVLPEDEECRKLMMLCCGFEDGILEKTIKDYPKHSLTNTYRGFARFMEEDLGACPEMTQQVSRCQRKKVAQRVALEMLQRNQAYSHLVELAHPKAIRVSIHQHKNQGPKFAVNLLPPGRFRPISSLGADALQRAGAVDDAQRSKVKEAHIPTPWHNVLVEIGEYAVDRNPVEDAEEPDIVYICHSGVVYEAGEEYESRYVVEHSRGARWCFKKRM